MLYPKEGTLEAIVLAKLLKGGSVTVNDFDDYPEITEKKLEELVGNLGSGMFESKQDDKIKFDS